MKTTFEINAVFSDLDGTLLNSEKKITPDTCHAIQELNKNGIPFVMASARCPAAIEPIANNYGLQSSIIAFSGGLILDEQRNILYQKSFSASDAYTIVNYIENSLSSVTWNIYTGNNWLVKDPSVPEVALESSITGVVPTAFDFTCLCNKTDSLKDSAVYKIMCMCDSKQILDVEQKLIAQFPEFSIVKSFDTLIEILPSGVDKADAVRHFCTEKKVSLRDTVAFGDNYNDLGMLKTVGHGVVMGNAPEEIRAMFSNVTDDNDHDGIAHALNTF